MYWIALGVVALVALIAFATVRLRRAGRTLRAILDDFDPAEQAGDEPTKRSRRTS